MKDVTSAYIAKENASTRKPVELYKIWYGTTYLYYTNGDVTVAFDDGDGTGSHNYTPATISRGSAEFDSTLDVNVMKIQFSAVTEPTVKYIAQNPVAIVWIQISRLFRDQSPLEASVIFIGQIKNANFKGTAVEAECVGFEHFLSMPIPILRYQLACNHQLFDAGCTLLSTDYDVPAVVTLDSTKTILASATFDTYADGYFIGGLITFGEERRTIVAHVATLITIQYRFQDLANGNTVTAYPGCDGDISTCKDKFNNILNFLGFPWIPDENPALRVP
jgi:uncharacterized phage protein (TIGR02218 family)